MRLETLAPIIPGIVVVLVFGLPTLLRVRSGRPLNPGRPADALFWQTAASGGSYRNLIARTASARNSLEVAVTPGRLIINPAFPLNLLTPALFGLELDIPKSAVSRLSRKSRAFGLVEAVLVEFADPAGGRSQTYELVLNDPEGFARAMGRGLEEEAREG